MARFNKTSSRSTMRLIGGSSHPELTSLIAKKVGVKPGQVILGKFANNETNVQLQEQVRCQDVYIIQTGAVSSNDAIMELLLLINSCKLASAESITVITPYFPYSKGDQKSSLRSPITAKLVANMLKRAGANHLMMLDPHSPQLEGFFDHPVDCLKVEPLFCKWIKQNIPNWRDCIVVSPDEGGAKRSVMIANSLGLEFAMIHNRHKKSLKKQKTIEEPMMNRDIDDLSDDIVQINIHQPPEELQMTHKMVDKYLKISGDVSGLNCIVVDDMIDSGSTIRLALEVLRTQGSGQVYVFATHGIFSGPCAQILLESPNLEKLVVTNSLPQAKNEESLGTKLEVVDISGMVSEFIRRSHYNESVSVLSQYYMEKDGQKSGSRKTSREELPDEADQLNINAPTQRLRKGFRLESVCWD